MAIRIHICRSWLCVVRGCPWQRTKRFRRWSCSASKLEIIPGRLQWWNLEKRFYFTQLFGLWAEAKQEYEMVAFGFLRNCGLVSVDFLHRITYLFYGNIFLECSWNRLHPTCGSEKQGDRCDWTRLTYRPNNSHWISTMALFNLALTDNTYRTLFDSIVASTSVILGTSDTHCSSIFTTTNQHCT